MITINLIPIGDESEPRIGELCAKWFAPVLNVNGVAYDLSELPDGATAWHPILGNVSRDGNDYECTVALPHGPNAPEQSRFPKPVMMTEDGSIDLPPYDAPPPEEPTNEQ